MIQRESRLVIADNTAPVELLVIEVVVAQAAVTVTWATL